MSKPPKPQRLRATVLLLLLVVLTSAWLPPASSARLPPQLRAMLAKFRRCQPSTLPGFSSSATLYDGLVIHWKAGGSAISMALQATPGSAVGTAAAGGGWFAVGWSSTGAMAGTDAVVRDAASSTPRTYYIGDYASFSKGTFALGATSITSSASQGTVMRFTRTVGDGTVPVKATGANGMVWAYSTAKWAAGNAAAIHSGRGTASVDFSCNSCRVFLFNLC